jgi:hypothetical protein
VMEFGSEVLIAVTVKNTVFWDVILCSLVYPSEEFTVSIFSVGE